MTSYLIVANQTLGGPRLDQAVQERIRQGESHFHVLVPMTPVKHETPVWTRGFSVPETMTAADLAEVRRHMEEEARRHDALAAEARRRAESRLGQMIDRIHALGGQAEGEVGEADPVDAVKTVLRDQTFDEVIVSTLPAGISRWLKMDLPSRVARMTDAPVTTIEARDGLDGEPS